MATLREIAFTKVSLPFGWMGNMAPYPIQLDGKTWRTSEALFQALRFAPDDPIREEIRAQKSPMAAKMVAKREKSRMVVEPQSIEDLGLMRLVLEKKLEAHPSLVTSLRNTGSALIVEDCTNRPRGSGLFWGAERVVKSDGTSEWRGLNHLGRLWMVLRDR